MQRRALPSFLLAALLAAIAAAPGISSGSTSPRLNLQFQSFPRLVASPGRVRPGSRLTVVLRVTGASGVRYRWLRDGHELAGATRNRRTVRSLDRGHLISVRVTAFSADRHRILATSAPRRVPR